MPQAPIEDRLRQALRELLQRSTPEREAPEPESRVSEEVEDRFPQLRGFLEATASQLRRNRSTLLFVQPPEQDVVVPAGEPFELWVQLPPMQARTADRVRFRAAERVLGEAPVRTPEVWLAASLDEPGVYTVTVEALTRKDKRIGFGSGDWSQRVQAFDTRPVVAVDAELALEPEPPVTVLRRLEAEGLQVTWVDLADERRADAVVQAVHRHGLPNGAVLSFPRDQGEFSTLGMDFRRVLVPEAARRARASGIALVALVTRNLDRFPNAESEGVVPLDVEAIEAGELDASELRARAEAFHARRRDADAFAFRLDERTKTRAVSGNRCHIELDNRRAREAVLAAIDGAVRSVALQVYIFEDGRFADMLSAHLIRAARRGVDVRILVDALYSGEQVLGWTNPILRTLRQEEGIEVRAVQPVGPSEAFEVRPLKERDHRKILVVDDERAFVTGRNVGDFYYTGFDEVAITDFTPHERVPWLDAHVDLAGPLVTEVGRSFARAWEENGGDSLGPAEGSARAGTTRARLVVHHGTDDANAMAAYEALLDAARDHVFIVNDFPIVSTLTQAVRRALARGVSVTLLTGNAVPRRGDGTFMRGPLHRELFDHLTKHRLDRLMRLGLEVYEWATDPDLPWVVCTGGTVRPYVHAKLMTADGRAMSLGSANLDATASFWEREANVVVEDPGAVAAVEEWIEGELAHAFRVDPEGPYWTRDRVLRGLVGTFWPDPLYS
ncbi:MAG: phospholipase D-like domain-containing protein [Myxococcota bacterium]